MTSLSLWTRASFTICSQPPCPASSHTLLLEIASGTPSYLLFPKHAMHFCRALVPGFPSVWTVPSLLSVLLFPQWFIFNTNLLPETFPESLISPPCCVLQPSFIPLACIHLFFKKNDWLLYTKRDWGKLAGTIKTIKSIKKYLECAKHCSRYWGDIGCRLLRMGSSHFEFKLYHMIRLGMSQDQSL